MLSIGLAICFFLNDSFFMGFLSLVQVILLIVAILNGFQEVKAKSSHMYVLLTLMAILLYIPLCLIGQATFQEKKNAEMIAWSDLELSSVLPEITNPDTELYTNSKSNLWMKVSDVSSLQYNMYIDACEEMGFTIDIIVTEYSFEAYNQEGYFLELLYSDKSDGAFEIQLDIPMELGEISWPDTITAQKAPLPSSMVGCIERDGNDTFKVYIGNMSKEDFAAYIDTCVLFGYTTYVKRDAYRFSAVDTVGYQMNANYEGYNTVSIEITQPERIAVTVSDNELTGENYQEVATRLEEAGFFNITEIPLADLSFGIFAKEDGVKSVVINEIDNFKEDDMFPIDSEVVISYHTFKED